MNKLRSVIPDKGDNDTRWWKWKTMKTGVKKEDFEVATDLYYVEVINS